MTLALRIVASLVGLASVLEVPQTGADAKQAPSRNESATIVGVITREPARVTLVTLVQRADVVALVSIRAGDTEHYADVVYKAFVLQAFKGTTDSQVIYFGPFRSYGLGSEYVVALSSADMHLSDLVNKTDSTSPAPFDGSAPYLRIMYEGYSVMPVNYTCAIPSCDYAVDIAYSQVTLPPHVTMTPNPGHNGASDHGWVRKRDFLAELSRLTPTGTP